MAGGDIEAFDERRKRVAYCGVPKWWARDGYVKLGRVPRVDFLSGVSATVEDVTGGRAGYVLTVMDRLTDLIRGKSVDVADLGPGVRCVFEQEKGGGRWYLDVSRGDGSFQFFERITKTPNGGIAVEDVVAGRRDLSEQIALNSESFCSVVYRIAVADLAAARRKGDGVRLGGWSNLGAEKKEWGGVLDSDLMKEEIARAVLLVDDGVRTEVKQTGGEGSGTVVEWDGSAEGAAEIKNEELKNAAIVMVVLGEIMSRERGEEWRLWRDGGGTFHFTQGRDGGLVFSADRGDDWVEYYWDGKKLGRGDSSGWKIDLVAEIGSEKGTNSLMRRAGSTGFGDFSWPKARLVEALRAGNRSTAETVDVVGGLMATGEAGEKRGEGEVLTISDEEKVWGYGPEGWLKVLTSVVKRCHQQGGHGELVFSDGLRIEAGYDEELARLRCRLVGADGREIWSKAANVSMEGGIDWVGDRVNSNTALSTIGQLYAALIGGELRRVGGVDQERAVAERPRGEEARTPLSWVELIAEMSKFAVNARDVVRSETLKIGDREVILRLDAARSLDYGFNWETTRELWVEITGNGIGPYGADGKFVVVNMGGELTVRRSSSFGGFSGCSREEALNVWRVVQEAIAVSGTLEVKQ